MMFRFAYPALLVLLAAPLAWVLYVWKKPPSGMVFSVASELASVAGKAGRGWVALPLLLRASCLLLLVLSAARPQLTNVSREILSPGVDIMLCIDASRSMRALDFSLGGETVTRLAAVKKVVADFIRKREADRIGLVVFGEQAFTQSPLTMDKGLLLELVRRMKVGMAGDRTAIGSAIAVGGKRMKDLKARSKILVLLTDGRHNAGEVGPVQAAEAVSALGIKIYTIGVGGTGPAPFRVRTLFGPRIVYQRVDLDEETLRRVARVGGGRYFRASDSAKLAEIYRIIDRAEKTEVKMKEFFHYRELYVYFLGPALLLLCLEIVAKTTFLRVIP